MLNSDPNHVLTRPDDSAIGEIGLSGSPPMNTDKVGFTVGVGGAIDAISRWERSGG